jgi:Zn-finger nucleic acid-binding protein
MSGAAAAIMAMGMSNAKRGESWHRQNKQKAKERQQEIRDKYKKLLTKADGELITELTNAVSVLDLPESSKKCPECNSKFSVVTVKGIEIDNCQNCHSFWFDSSELMEFTAMDDDVPSAHLTSRKSKYCCPVCAVRMRECVYLNPNNLLVDNCEEHGVYLENQELNRVIEVTQKS